MQDRPGALELLEAVQAHLAQAVVPMLGEPGLRFRTLVAANVLGIVRRELALAGYTRFEHLTQVSRESFLPEDIGNGNAGHSRCRSEVVEDPGGRTEEERTRV